VQTFATVRDAKEFLIARIISTAQNEGAPLSEVERKMLYFSETAWTLPDMVETNDAFDRDYDQSTYEQRIGTLAHKFCAEARKTNRDDLDSWKEAVHTISPEDHYLLVLIRGAASADSPVADRLKLVTLAFLITLLILAGIYLFANR
jgi:predicted dithiol-disulfide oxidoreductase (DUF899 family)